MKFYILITCSIIIFVTSLFNAGPIFSTSSTLAMIFMVLVIRKTTDTVVSNIAQYILGAMVVIFFYVLYIRNF